VRSLILVLTWLFVVGVATAQTPGGRPNFESINGRPQFPGNSVKCDWDGTAGTDDTAAMNAALANFTSGTTAQIAPGKHCLIDSADLIIPANVRLEGVSGPGSLNGATAAILMSGSGLAVNPLYTVRLNAGSELRSLAIRRKDLIRNPTVAQVNSQVQTWLAENSVGVLMANTNAPGIVIDNVFVVGFNSCFKTFVGRVTLNNVNGDCALSGFEAQGIGDIISVSGARFEPYYRSGSASAGDASRPGAAFNLHDNGNGIQIINSFSFQYGYGLVSNNSLSVWVTNTTFEGHSSTYANGMVDTAGVRILGGAGQMVFTGVTSNGYDKGFTNESTGGGIWFTNTMSTNGDSPQQVNYYLGAAPAASPPTVTWSGSITPGQVAKVTFTDATNIPGSPLAISYTLQTGDTPTKVSQALAMRINLAWQLSKNYIRAASPAAVITIQYPTAYTTGSPITCTAPSGMTCVVGTGTASLGSQTMLNGVYMSTLGHIEVGTDSTNSVANAFIQGPWPINAQPTGGWLQVGAASAKFTKVYDYSPLGVSATNLSACGTSPVIQATNSNDRAGVIRAGAGATGCALTFTQPYPGVPMCNVAAVGDTGAITTLAATATTLTVGLTDRTTFRYECDANGPNLTGTYTMPRATGWGVGTNGNRVALDGATATLPQTSAAVAALIADLTARGIIGP